jgi:hypothetical protein
MTIILILPILFVGAYCWYIKNLRIDALRAKRKPKHKAKSIRKKPNKAKFRCVVIKAGAGTCWSAMQLKTTPILMHEASALPLKTCDADKCNCRYKRYDDRRMRSRRHDLYGAVQFMATQKSRRKTQDRRANTNSEPNTVSSLGQPTIMLD